jgi:FAD dependent oxidoreductase TIGR03364
MSKPSAIIVGAGIVGMAIARALAIKGYEVKIFERTHKATGASIRNFGMIWPIGQTEGKMYDRAMRSRSIWQSIAQSGAFWHDPVGSIHLAYHDDEWQVLQELYEVFNAGRDIELLTPQQATAKSPAVVSQNLKGGLFSSSELIVDPREAIAALPAYLEEQYEIEFNWGKCVSYVADNNVYVGNNETYEADIVFICSGSDFETLYPEAFAEKLLTKCKLQMMRFTAQPNDWRIGPALCGGLSLIHYKSFTAAKSLPALKRRYEEQMPNYLEMGIHVMVSQNGNGELIVGDSHEYGLTLDPFDRESINKMIVDYLGTFAQFKDNRVAETWNGVYAKRTDGEPDIVFSPEPGVYVVTGIGGAGMTLSFGLAEELVENL